MEIFKKQIAEEYAITVNFSNVLDDDETILTKTVTATLHNKVVTSIVIDSSFISGETVIIKIKDGTENNYKITTKITTSADNTYEEDVLMKVIDT